MNENKAAMLIRKIKREVKNLGRERIRFHPKRVKRSKLPIIVLLLKKGNLCLHLMAQQIQIKIITIIILIIKKFFKRNYLIKFLKLKKQRLQLKIKQKEKV